MITGSNAKMLSREIASTLGGEDGNLVQNGSNIWFEAGTYYITLDIQTTKKHIDPTYTDFGLCVLMCLVNLG